MRVAQVLEAAGADGFGVATWDEALELREAGIAAPILVLYPIPAAHAADAARHDVAVTVGDAALLDELLAVRAGAAGDAAPLAVQLEVETGLGRGGVPADQVSATAARIAAAPGVRLAGLWSHLQDPGDPDRSASQAARFAAARTALAEGGLAVPDHLAASGALVLGGPDATGVVRPGLVTYGIVPDDLEDRPSPLAAALRPVMAIEARPVRVADLPAGHGISYGPAFTTRRPSRIATLPIGYGDGWARALSDRAEAVVRGVPVPLVGRVAMDAVMADVTDVPGPPVTPADTFTLLGPGMPAAELARRRTTISWEVVTAVSRRMPRVYHAADAATGVRTLVGWRAVWHASNSGTATSATSRSTPS